MAEECPCTILGRRAHLCLIPGHAPSSEPSPLFQHIARLEAENLLFRKALEQVLVSGDAHTAHVEAMTALYGESKKGWTVQWFNVSGSSGARFFTDEVEADLFLDEKKNQAGVVAAVKNAGSVVQVR